MKKNQLAMNRFQLQVSIKIANCSSISFTMITVQLYTQESSGMTHNSADAEDILQNAFVKIWGNITSFDEFKGRPFTWMLSICRNEVIDYCRKQKARNGR